MLERYTEALETIGKVENVCKRTDKAHLKLLLMKTSLHFELRLNIDPKEMYKLMSEIEERFEEAVYINELVEEKSFLFALY